MNPRDTLKALVQNYKFNLNPKGKLPPIDFVYPDFTADGNSESFRFSSSLRKELRERSELVKTALSGKTTAWTINYLTLREVDSIAPRLGILDIINNRINSIYSGYAPLLLIGKNEADFEPYIIKSVIDRSMAWFEFTPEEKKGVNGILTRCATSRPYRNLMQRVKDGLMEFVI